MSNFQLTQAYLDSVHENIAKDIEDKKSCNNCLNRCMDMDMDPYCSAVNKPWGSNLYRGKPAECGTENKFWQIDTRRRTL